MHLIEILYTRIMGNQQIVLCGSNIGPSEQEEAAKIVALVQQNRKQFPGLPNIPNNIQQKIVNLFKCQSLLQVATGRKTWQVIKPRHFFYTNQLGKEEQVPCGLCTIYLYNQKNEFAAFFRGHVNEFGLRQNKNAIYVFRNGDYFVGDSNKSDSGVYKDQTGQYTYEGQWMNGKPHGIGKETSTAGLYQGYFLDGKKQGSGKFTFQDGYIYEGQFKDNRVHGKGCLKSAKQKYQYVGEFKLGEKSGVGVQTTKEYKYEGEFVRNIKTGSGKIFYPQQDIGYEGGFKNGSASGAGKAKIKQRNISGYWEGGQLKMLFQGS